jgi:hypothetical protein
MRWMGQAPEVEFRSDENPDPVLHLGYEPNDADFGSLTVRIRAGGLACDESALRTRFEMKGPGSG